LYAAAKVIILLSAGEESDSEPREDIKQTIAAGKQLAGDATVLSFGLKTGQQSTSFNLISCRYKYIIGG